MKNRLRSSFILIGVVVIALLLVSVFAYVQQKHEPANKQPTTGSCKTFDGKEYCAEKYTGLKEEEAISMAEDDGLTARVVEADDGRSITINSNVQPKRINFTIANDMVTKAEFY